MLATLQCIDDADADSDADADADADVDSYADAVNAGCHMRDGMAELVRER